MPQVDAVGDAAEVDERRVAQRPRQAAGLGRDHREQEDPHSQRHQELTPGEQEARRAVQPPPQGDQPEQRGPAEHLGGQAGGGARQLPRRDGPRAGPAATLDVPSMGRWGGAEPGGAGGRVDSGELEVGQVGDRQGQSPPATGPHGQADGQDRADEDVLAARVGSLVHAGHRGVVDVVPAHDGRRGQDPGHGRGQHRPELPGGAQSTTQVEQAEDHRRPHQVELLLDRQRPHVRQGRRLCRLGEVVRAAHDEVPVGHVEERRERVEPERGEFARGGHEVGVRSDADQDQEEGRQQAARPAHPELPETDGEPPCPLAQQQRGDQEAGQDEEHVDAEEPARRERRPTVVQQHAEHGDGPDPVESRHVAEHDGAPAGRRRDGRHRGDVDRDGVGDVSHQRGTPASRCGAPGGRAGRVIRAP